MRFQLSQSWHALSLFLSVFVSMIFFQPIRACILGPPASGKTFLIANLTKTYKTHHIKLTEILNDAVAVLLEKYSSLTPEELEDIEDDEDKRLYETIQHVLEGLKEREKPEEPVYEDILDDIHITRFCKEKLQSMPCRNQGFILDGFPKTLDQAKDLFSVEETEEAAPEETAGPAYDTDITPEYVFILDATDEFLKERVFAMTHEQLAASYKTDSSFSRLLVDYRDSNSEDEPNPIAAYFKELEIKVENIDIAKDKPTDTSNSSTLDTITKILGEARSYGPTNYEKLEIDLAAAEETLKKHDLDEVERTKRESEERAAKQVGKEEMLRQEEDERNAEVNILVPKVLPMRNYLMRAVMPTLIEGLIDCVKHRPENGIDHLAEYIFKRNPQECYMPLEEEAEEEVEPQEGDDEGVESMAAEIVECREKGMTSLTGSIKTSPVSTPQSRLRSS